ncbi:ABC transporter substrate-binding protein [Pelagibacterium luteolum]|uniref:Iron complex transport system substrate-binding protein n=1 Tax=Pelagibacterium luteolum TaxID=440168 RepID=A0A1G7WDU7_9HYPH|nr:ABC transporter substrate-binding protein [Pelagibacterium luteolum]SDG70142.1 iron complex transport system substrate-binding protein [Pelagibacterium luteolum]
MNRLMKSGALALVAAALCASVAIAQEWSFTDAAGNTVTLDNPPERIVAFSSSAAGLMQFGIEPVGVFTDESASDKSLAEFELDGIEVIRTAWNQLQPESLLALDPDLIVTEWWPRTDGYSGGDQMGPEGQFASVAPIIGIEQGGSVLEIIERYGALAEALGADLNAPEIVADREAFETARAAFAEAAAANPGLKVMAAYASEDSLMVAAPSGSAELQDFTNWGLDVVVPDAPEGEYWSVLSWENADIYRTDVLLLDDRSGDDMRATVDAQPLAARMPSVAAGQVGDWPAWWIRTYGSYTAELEELTALIESAEVVTE